MWQVGGHVYDTYSVELFRTDPTEIRIPVSQPFYDSLHEIAEFHCVVVRYGTEEALRAGALPTERDKIDGQPQLKSVQVSLQPKNGEYLLSFSLRVHRYLGTQFKLYATAKNPLAIQEVVKKLEDVSEKDENCAGKFDVDFSNKPTKIMCVTQGGIHNEKVFFLVDKYNSALSADGRIINNFANPGGT
jgi:hypothetical protein